MATSIPALKESEQIEFGERPTDEHAVADPSRLVIASYNIRYAVGPHLISGGLARKIGFGGMRLRDARVAGNIRRAANTFTEGKLMPRVDVLALQEADKSTGRSGRHHIARELAGDMRMNWVHVPAGLPRGVKPKTRQWWLDFEQPIDLYDPGDTGIGLISRLSMTDVTRIDLPWHECAWRPRLAMGVTIMAGEENLRIFNAHVDPHAAVGGQLEQLQVLVDHANRTNGPVLILGDFNTLSKTKVDETKSFMGSHGYSTPFTAGTPTWRGMGIRLHADWVFTRDVKVTKWGVAHPSGISDHWPIWVEVDLTQHAG